MAYKTNYQIPNSLEKTVLDHEIVLVKSSFIRPLPLKVLLFYVISLLCLFWVVSSTFVKSASFGFIALFVLWWILATLYFGQYSKTKELKFMQVPGLVEYAQKANRHVSTRTNSNVSGFYNMVRVKKLDQDGHITFSDGTVGRAYVVVGSASILVFEDDKRHIINRVDSFYRKMHTSVEYIWLTTKEPQRVTRQLAQLERRNMALEIREPELFVLLDEQASILTEFVGKRFSSIHQYLVVKANNEEELMRTEALLDSEVRDSSLMLKSCAELNGEGFAEMARAVFAHRI